MIAETRQVITGSGVSYEVYSAEQDLQGNRKRITYSYDAKPLFRLPAGDYFIAVKYGEKAASGEITVSPGEQKKTQLTLN